MENLRVENILQHPWALQTLEHYGKWKKNVHGHVPSWASGLDVIDILIIWSIFMYFFLKFWDKFSAAYDEGLITSLKSWGLKNVRRLPFVQRKIQIELDKVMASFGEDINKMRTKKTTKLPAQGYNQKSIRDRIDTWVKRDAELIKNRKIGGTIYTDNLKDDFMDLVKDYSKEYLYANPLHYDLFPSVTQMEAEIISMTANLFHPTDKTCGIVTSGGTESLLLMVLAYRDWGRERGIDKPNMVVCETAHVAVMKAAHLFGVKVIRVPLHKSGRMDVGKMASNINSNTVGIFGSVVDFPFGFNDPIEELSKLAIKKKINLHVDCCLGGIVAVFAKDCGVDLGKFDFELPGVTSISIDPHKHCQGPKGNSVLLFANSKIRSYAYFFYSEWNGGFYGTPTLLGSRTGAPIAGVWMTLVHHGIQGMKDIAAKVIKGVEKYKNEIRKIPELEIIGNPKVCVVTVKAKAKNLNILDLQAALNEKGWHLSTSQKPMSIQFSVTSFNADMIDDLIRDMKLSVRKAIDDPNPNPTGVVAMYCSSAKLPSELVNEGGKIGFDAILKI
jgi:sphinganine-1-phosphate aldolase